MRGERTLYRDISIQRYNDHTINRCGREGKQNAVQRKLLSQNGILSFISDPTWHSNETDIPLCLNFTGFHFRKRFPQPASDLLQHLSYTKTVLPFHYFSAARSSHFPNRSERARVKSSGQVRVQRIAPSRPENSHAKTRSIQISFSQSLAVFQGLAKRTLLPPNTGASADAAHPILGRNTAAIATGKPRDFTCRGRCPHITSQGHMPTDGNTPYYSHTRKAKGDTSYSRQRHQNTLTPEGEVE